MELSTALSPKAQGRVQMSDLAAALRDKISALEDEKEELEDSLARIELKLETFSELLAEETGEAAPATAAPRKKSRGRPKGSKNKKTTAKKSAPAPKDNPAWAEASGRLPDGSKGSTAEEQARAVQRFNPTPRPSPNYGVKAGTPEEVMGTKADPKKSNVSIEVED